MIFAGCIETTNTKVTFVAILLFIRVGLDMGFATVAQPYSTNGLLLEKEENHVTTSNQSRISH